MKGVQKIQITPSLHQKVLSTAPERLQNTNYDI
jgi:hypothetical protein